MTDPGHGWRCCDGVLADWLVQEDDLVDAGDPLARLYPEVSQ